jgi:hypothetical protein
MNYFLEQTNNLLDHYEDTVIKLREEISKLKMDSSNDWIISLDMYMYSLRYTLKLIDAYRNTPIQFYKDEVLDMMHKFEKHAVNNKDSRLYNLNISIVEYCENAYKEMIKIPTK